MRIIITNESVYEWAAYYTVKCILDYSDRKKPLNLIMKNYCLFIMII